MPLNNSENRQKEEYNFFKWYIAQNCKKRKTLIPNNYKRTFFQTQMIEHFVRFVLQQFSVIRTTQSSFPLQKYGQTKNREQINIKNYMESIGFI